VAVCASVAQSDRWCQGQGLAALAGFRDALYGCVARRADAWFELGDALLTSDGLVWLPHLSLEPVHRRGHGSTYAALAHGAVDGERLRALLAAQLHRR
jgi:hypothetical protein